MVALESPAAAGPTERARRHRGGLGWSVAAGCVLVVGISLRLALGGTGIGDRSAIVMATILSVGVWLATLLLSTPRTAFLVSLGVVGLFVLAALPARNAPVYDDREAFFRTDQVITAQVPTAPGLVATDVRPTLVVLAEPVFPAGVTQPRFGLAGDVGSGSLAWDCAFQRGLQQLALPLPPTVVMGTSSIDVRLQLTGSPSRESDYLLVYASAPRGGFLISLVGATEVGPNATMCSLRS